MKAKKIRKEFLDYFKSKKHKIIKSSNLIPDDSSVLLTTAGMQQFVPYFLGKIDPEEHFRNRTLTSVQKCFRTSCIDEVGDETHHTFFEMLGNFSIGGYFKEGAIEHALELLLKKYKLDKERLYITVFKGEKGIPKDKEAIDLWVKKGMDKKKISEFGSEDNFWGPPGLTGPCGPCSEVHFDLTKKPCGKSCKPNCSCGRFIEIWNLVFMQYNKDEKGKYTELPMKNIDTGMGLERMALVLQKKNNNYETDLFVPLIKILRKNKYELNEDNKRAERIIVDHIRGSVFLINDGVIPSNVEQGYILRRVLRRSLLHLKLLKLDKKVIEGLINQVIKDYDEVYTLKKNKKHIHEVIKEEQDKFSKTIDKGLRLLDKLIKDAKKKTLDTKKVFSLFHTYGFPLEFTKEIARENKLKVDEKALEKEFKKHQEISRAGVEKKFGGVGQYGIKVARQHTATHLLHQALRDVLGNTVQQAGSDLTPERLRFDFTFPRKLTEEEKDKVEKRVNKKIKENLKVSCEEMDYEDAIEAGALAFFKEKYGKKVNVYSIGNYSKELCAGPHVKNTKEIKSFKIVKEKSSAAGIRRIKAIVGL